ncbi:YwqG family protein [Nonomuraea pusilla]|uniref:YwqG family protein n=1 Tax=Nonomuraea pusilla TaxID=46177 RepID=UPI00332E6B86
MQGWLLDFAEYVRELLPEELAEPFIALARPAVRLSVAEKGENVVGRLGGLPRLPEEVPWPRAGDGGPAMQFLAELDCAALAAYESDIDLPAEGTLLFFTTWDRTTARVIPLPPGAVRVAEREVPVRGEARVFPEVPLTAVTEPSWPDLGHPAVLDAFGSLDAARELVWDRVVYLDDEDADDGDGGETFAWELELYGERRKRRGPRHQVGGYSDALQSPVEAAAASAAGLDPKDPGFAAEASQWVTLLQLGEDNGMIFGDGAVLIFGIRRNRLAARDFSQIFPYVQGH